MNTPGSLRLFAIWIVWLCSFASANAQTAPIRIMPLGDSITYGSGGTSNLGGYRGPLYTLLTNAGYNVDYIGSQTGNSASIPDQNHEGHGGWRIDQLDSNIAGWFASMADPDVVLMHIGTNDFGQNFNITTAIDRLDALILKIATLRPYCHIIVTNLMERSGTANTNIQNLFNPYVQARVNAHAAAGRRVTFLDMRSAVPLTDMPDNLHPNQAGYDKMAAAWLPAIQAVTGPQGDAFPPAILRAVGNGDRTHVAITFSKPLADSAAAVANFTLSGGLTVSAAQLDSSKRVITLTTSQQTLGASYTATVNGVTDRTPAALALPANSTVAFNGATPRGYLNNVPESAGYTLACSLDIPAVANFGSAAVPYAVDNRNAIGPFTRVAYYLELQTASGDLQYVWASMNAFTADAGKIGVPTLASGAVFQQGVSGMNVVSNVPGVSTGTGLAGNLEFWPTNYQATNSAGVPGASGTLYDFGDQQTAGTYGSMQLHNPGVAKTIFAFNNWGGTATATSADLGIGNGIGANPDWTFTNNAGGYVVRSLQVLVQTGGDATPPALAAATSFGRTGITVGFSEPLAGASVKAENFTLNGGVIVLGARLAANQRDVVLLTTAQPTGTPLTLTVSGVRDSSPSANLITPGSAIAVTAGALPAAIVANVPESAGYQLVYSMNIPATGNFNAAGGGYAVDYRLETGSFSRVAYYVELRKSADPAPTFVWTAMDAFTTDPGKIGIPTAASGASFQRNVTNLSVVSNAAGIVTGTGMPDGNIEFWPGNYSAANAVSVPNASATTNDFGDTMNAGTGYGSMQVHNHATGAVQTLFALNHWGTDGSPLCLGIGNRPTGDPDWTFADNAATYNVTRVLHVLVLPSAPSDTTGPVMTAAKGSSTLSRLVVTFNEPLADTAASAANFSSPGLTVTGATLLAGQKEIALTTSAQTPGTVYTISASGVRDRAGGNLILPGATATFTAVSAPPVLGNIPEAAGYNLIYKLPIPNSATYNTNAVPYTIDESKYPQLEAFDRVAYCLELQLAAGGASTWVYVSADAFATQLGRIGVPTTASGAVFQQNLSNLNVAASPGTTIATGTGLPGGNIEFWPTNYSAGNGSGVPNGSATNYDFGDTRSTTGTYGSMQIHNHAASQTIFAYNNWGGSSGNSDIGIGNDPAPVSLGVDWTFHHNAAAYSTKNLYILARPGGTPAGTGPLVLSHPTSRTVSAGGNTTFAISVNGAGPFYFQWRLNGAPIAGATNPWLDLIGVGNADVGGYDVVVTASGGASTTSQAGILTILNPPPTVTVTPSGTVTGTSPIAFTLTFSESVTGLGAGGITVTNGSIDTLAGSGATYTVSVIPTAQGGVTCRVNAGAANGNIASNTASVTYDSVAPGVTVAPSGSTSGASPITFSIAFSEAVTGLAAAGITVTNGTLGTIEGGGATYTIPVLPSGQGPVTCQVIAAAAQDDAGNHNTASNIASVTYDSVAPTVTVTPSGTSTAGSPITFTLSFSEPVTGLAASGITVTNGTKGTLSGGGSLYTISVAPAGQGAVMCQVNSGAAIDAGSNGSTASNVASVNYDTVAPSVVVATSGSTTGTWPITFTLTFSEPVGGFSASGISVTNGTKGTLEGGGATYTIAVAPSGQGAVTCQVIAAAAQDGAGNHNTPSNTATVTYDSVGPTVSIGAPSVSTTTSGPVTYSVSYVDANFNASTLAPGDITLNKTGTAGGTVGVTGTGTTRTVTISGVSGEGTLGISITSGTATDTVGNTAPAAGPSVTFTVSKASQTITFGALAAMTYGDAPFTLGGTASSGLAVSYISSVPAVATVSGNTVTIVGAGTTTITASQAGNANYAPAPDVAQPLTVSPVLPLPWVQADIGTPGAVGTGTSSGGVYTIAGAGTISGKADAFHFAYQPLSADGQIVVRIPAFQNTGTSARVGIMMRDTLAAGSRSAFLGVNGSGGFQWIRRSRTGGNSTTTTSGTGTAPNVWVRLTRVGSTITAYRSINGTTWTTIGSDPVTMATNCYIGIAVASGATVLNTSTFDNVSVVP